ncbi:MAG: hypothetical protein U0905_18080 [Pirellulales bacterium]
MAVLDRRTVLAGLAALPLLASARPLFAVDPYGPENAAITVVVMDPMALPLACDCVQGYAQRKYEVLADYLKAQLGQSVRVVGGNAEVGLQSRGTGKKTIVIGKGFGGSPRIQGTEVGHAICGSTHRYERWCIAAWDLCGQSRQSRSNHAGSGWLSNFVGTRISAMKVGCP